MVTGWKPKHHIILLSMTLSQIPLLHTPLWQVLQHTTLCLDSSRTLIRFVEFILFSIAIWSYAFDRSYLSKHLRSCQTDSWAALSANYLFVTVIKTLKTRNAARHPIVKEGFFCFIFWLSVSVNFWLSVWTPKVLRAEHSSSTSIIYVRLVVSSVEHCWRRKW